MTPNVTDESIITVLLVDDHPVTRAGYRRLLESTTDIRVVAEASDGETGCLLYQEHKPSVVIIDLNMPKIDGLETIRRIKAKDAKARILVFSLHNNETIARYTLKTGATGYITKQADPEQMVQAIRLVQQGKVYIDPKLASNMATSIMHDNTGENTLSVLSTREFQIFKLIAEGNTSTQIAKIISISPKTVGVHHSNIMRKLKLKNITQLVRLSIKYNIIVSNK